MIRVLLADDHTLFRSMLEEMLMRDNGLTVVASCSNGEEAISCCRSSSPDITLLDIGMSGIGGIKALEAIKENCPQTKVAMLTTFEDSENIKKALLLGADGYLIKDMEPEILVMSIKCINAGMVMFHHEAYNHLKTAVSAESQENRVRVGKMVFDGVEINIMRLIVQGKSNKDIGAALNYSEGTIKNKVSKILANAGLTDRVELSVFAINNGIV